VSFEHRWNPAWSSHIGFYASTTDFRNPTIRNYEIRKEENWGGRADTQFHFDNGAVKGKITAGAEYQHFFSPDAVYDNNLGTAGNLQTDDRLRSQLFLTFAQAELDLPKRFYLTVGASGNFIQYNFLRTSLTPEVKQDRSFSPVLSPRVAVLKKLSSTLSAYGSISSGFSPPSLAEVRPSTGAFNNNLNSERGTSYEVGLKGKLFGLLDATVAVYDFELKETIVIQRDASGADYFINAGATSQKGAELMLNWSRSYDEGRLSSLRFWSSYTYNYYKFKEYVNDGKNYSGNSLTGVPPVTVAVGGDLVLRKGFYANITAYYSDRLPLNDANTDYASDYFLVGTRVGYRMSKKLPLEFFGGVDNALDVKYSLGNDLNAVGGRYFNAAPKRNFYVGVSLRLPSTRK
jgi:iron complex outermembrane receptor protein